MQVDIAIVGAGPVGLGFAQSLQGSGYSMALLDRQPLNVLAAPVFDGREIALTHASRHILEGLGAWQRIPERDISVLRDAHIFNGPSRHALTVDAALVGVDELGYFVPNHMIRKALFEAVQARADVQLRGGVNVTGIQVGAQANTLQLSDGQTVQARLVVAADSRYSETRRMMGIAADMHDFARTMLVCRFEHEAEHEHISWQWFDYGQTLALLPLNGRASNVVLTLPQHEMQALLDMDAAEFSANITARFAKRLGAMQQAGKPHTYPLVGAYARQFVAHRYALVGDAAVGMHPITAHGFNFGLQSQKRLADQLWLAKRRNAEVAEPAFLATYERQHRAATWPLYQATNAIAKLYTDDRAPLRAVRGGLLRVAQAVQPFRKVLANHLTQMHG